MVTPQGSPSEFGNTHLRICAKNNYVNYNCLCVHFTGFQLVDRNLKKREGKYILLSEHSKLDGK